MPLLRGCCNLDLQIGTKIIGIISLIFSIIGFLSILLMLGVYILLKEIVLEHVRQGLEEGFQDVKLANLSQTDKNYPEEIAHDAFKYLEANSHLVTIVIVVLLCQQLLDIICSSCLIHGIRKNTRGLLMPWIVTQVLYLIIEVGIIVIFLVALGIIPPLYPVILPVVAIYLLWIALHIYLILVVISQFQALGLIRMHDEMCMK